MNHELIHRLIADEASGRYSRRQIFKRGAALGISAPAIAALLGAAPRATLCPGCGEPTRRRSGGAPRCRHLQGWLRRRVRADVNEMYNQLYPDATSVHRHATAQEQFQPRFVAGDPPDVMDNSGAGNLEIAALVAEGQLADLADLMAAPPTTLKAPSSPRPWCRAHKIGVFDGVAVVLYCADGLRHLVRPGWFDEQG